MGDLTKANKKLKEIIKATGKPPGKNTSNCMGLARRRLEIKEYERELYSYFLKLPAKDKKLLNVAKHFNRDIHYIQEVAKKNEWWAKAMKKEEKMYKSIIRS